jgi:hypothetical protein
VFWGVVEGGSGGMSRWWASGWWVVGDQMLLVIVVEFFLVEQAVDEFALINVLLSCLVGVFGW